MIRRVASGADGPRNFRCAVRNACRTAQQECSRANRGVEHAQLFDSAREPILSSLPEYWDGSLGVAEEVEQGVVGDIAARGKVAYRGGQCVGSHLCRDVHRRVVGAIRGLQRLRSAQNRLPLE